jgi:hypothetical protein
MGVYSKYMVVVGAAVPTKASYSVCSAVLPLMLELPDPYASHTKLLNSRFCTGEQGLCCCTLFGRMQWLPSPDAVGSDGVNLNLHGTAGIDIRIQVANALPLGRPCHELSAHMSCINDVTEMLILHTCNLA